MDLLASFDVDSKTTDKFWNELKQNYSEKDRYYHNLNHLSDLYLQLLPFQSQIKNWKVILFTLFYHDIIYKSTKKNNEEKSAELAVQRMEELNVNKSDIESCYKQIIATKSHTKSVNSDTNYFTDADLSILGREWINYKNYCDNIRKEYAIYPDFIYNKGRKKVIKHFLQMERIYKTKAFFEKYETQARSNLLKEMVEF